MKERSPFPDKHKPQKSFKEVTGFLQKAANIVKELRLGQNEATWHPYPDYPNVPIAILLASDMHYGSVHTDYDTLLKHFKIVEDTPNFYMMTNGDHVDNFSPAVYPSGMTENPLPPSVQINAFFQKMLMLDRRSKLGLISQGNHDNFVEAAGLDFWQSFLGDISAPVFDKGGIINIMTPQHYRMVVSHMYWGRSKINITNAPKRLLEFEGRGTCDIAWMGHTHQSSYEQFTKGDREYIAIVSGSYKREDPWAARRGISLNRAGEPGMTLMLWPKEKKMQVFRNPETAQQFLLNLIFREERR